MIPIVTTEKIKSYHGKKYVYQWYMKKVVQTLNLVFKEMMLAILDSAILADFGTQTHVHAVGDGASSQTS
ncbi:MAG: hypothetical protein QM487_01670 [Candidatus Marithrix sp.]